MLAKQKSAVTEGDAAYLPPVGRTVPLVVLCLISVLCGIIAAIGAVALRFLIAIVHNLCFYGTFSLNFDGNQFYEPSVLGPFIILVPVIAGVIVVYFVRAFAPEANGHGVPEVIYSIYYNNGNVRAIVSVIKLIASGISIGSGASVGREGPIIQIGASFGSTIARLFDLVRYQRIILLAAGGAAGIAATFNTPLGGVLFAVEILLPEISAATLLPVVVATATATYFARMWLGADPAFHVPFALASEIGVVDPIRLIMFAVLGLAAGVLSWAFVWFLDWCEEVAPKLPGNAYTTNIAGMLVVGIMNYAFLMIAGHYYVAGVGYGTIQSIFEGGHFTILLLLVLTVAKLFSTSLSLGVGASGGVFSPALFIGATLGGAIGLVGDALFPGHGFTAAEFGLVGMAAVVGGSTSAALTAIVMVFEMTRDYNIIVPLVLAVAIAVGVRKALIADNMYTTRLRRRGRPVPSDRFTNMYLVRQAQKLMSTKFRVMPANTLVKDALAQIKEHDIRHIIVSDEGRIAGFARLSANYQADRFSKETLRDLMATDFVIAGEETILNTIISRMNLRQRSLAIVVHSQNQGVPRPDDIAGVIDSTEIASAVIANHYA